MKKFEGRRNQTLDHHNLTNHQTTATAISTDQDQNQMLGRDPVVRVRVWDEQDGGEGEEGQCGSEDEEEWQLPEQPLPVDRDWLPAGPAEDRELGGTWETIRSFRCLVFYRAYQLELGWSGQLWLQHLTNRQLNPI